jgi:hypothetical protein
VATEAVEEPDPTLRASLLREAYWERAREQITASFAEGKGWPLERASKVLEAAVLKPSPSEKRQYPGIERAPEPVG